MTQSGLGQVTGMAANMISRIESGERPTPQFVTVARMAAALGISLDTLAVECGLVVPPHVRGKSAATESSMGDLLRIQREAERLQLAIDAALARQPGALRAKRRKS